MSDDALAALLREMDLEEGYDCAWWANWLRAQGVVVLPPAVAEVLRTGEPSEVMVLAVAKVRWARSEEIPMAARFDDAPAFVQKAYCETARWELRAALAVLREP